MKHKVSMANTQSQYGQTVRENIKHSYLEHHRRGAFQQRAVDDVGVPGDPPDVRGAPVHLPGFVIERVLERGPGAEHVPGGCMHDTLGLAGAARGVQHEQRVLGLDPLAVAIRGDLVHLVVPPRVSAVDHRTLAREAFVHDDGLDGEVVFAQLCSWGMIGQ